MPGWSSTSTATEAGEEGTDVASEEEDDSEDERETDDTGELERVEGMEEEAGLTAGEGGMGDIVGSGSLDETTAGRTTLTGNEMIEYAESLRHSPPSRAKLRL
jgi:hypothetical protein